MVRVMDTSMRALRFFKHVTLCTLSLFVVSCAIPQQDTTANAVQAEAPNILFIYTDDQAPWALGYAGNPQAITPNLDLLASQGMYLPNAYSTTPVCSPSRAGLLTSRYGFEVGIDDWINTNLKARTLSGHQPNLGLDPALETWPEVLQRNGYKTGLIGKWHLGEKSEYHPTEHGYETFVGFLEGGARSAYPELEIDKKAQAYPGLTVDVLTEHAISFIRSNKHNKFALSVHLRAPHHPFLPVASEDLAALKEIGIGGIKLPHPDYPNLNTKRATRLMFEYLASVASIDRNVGKLMAELNSLGLDNNTVVIFTSDHGFNIGHNGMWHKGNGFWLLNEAPASTSNIPQGQRPNMFDNSIKVPTLVRWPSVIPAGSVNPSSMSNLDWFPTLLSLSNSKKSGDTMIRGKDFMPALMNPDTVLSTDYYAVYSMLHQSLTHMRMYSDGKYKLIRDFNNEDRDEFYDLVNDPDETNNLIGQGISAAEQAIIKQFDGIIFQKMQETNDPVLPLIGRRAR